MTFQLSEPVRRTLDEARLDPAARIVYDSLLRVAKWVEDHNYEAYEPFDGLSSPLRRFTFGNLLADRLLMQTVRQSPINLRPLFGIKPLPSTKGRGYMAAGYLAMHQLTGEDSYKMKAVTCLDWLIRHKSPKFEEFSWANHFGFAGRGGGYSRDESIIVWTALVAQAFLDGFEMLGDRRYFQVAQSACRWILTLPRERTATGTCLSYYMIGQSSVHNANMLGAAILARMWRHSHDPELLAVASDAMRYSCSRQQPDGSWLYAEASKYHWIDNFHTGYNLDSLQAFVDATGDESYRGSLRSGLDFFKRHFIREDGCPRYYHNRTQPIDSQCAAQAIETLSRFAEDDEECLDMAKRVALWAIGNMQDRDGHFYYRAYPLIKAKAPMLHWAQATMYRGLVALLGRLVCRMSTTS